MGDTLPSQPSTPQPEAAGTEPSAGPATPLIGEKPPAFATSVPVEEKVFQPQAPQPSPTTPVQSVITTPPEKPASSKFSIFVGFLIVVTLAIYGFVGYLYLQNSQLKKEIKEKSSGQLSGTPTVTPTPEIGLEIKIVNGNVVEVAQSGETKTLVNKADYPSTGITGFAKVAVSPDAKMFCFEAWPPAPEPALYLADIDGSNLMEVSPNRKDCYWTSDSQKIVYTNTSSDSTPVDIFIYDIAKDEEKNLTGGLTGEGFIRFYEIVGLSEDGGKIECKYSETTSAAEGTTTEGNCEINLTTLKLKEI